MIGFGTMFLTLFLMMDPIGNTASFSEVMKIVPRKRYWKVLIRELCIALGFMLLFNSIGEYILTYLHLDQITIRFTAGLILFIFALGVLFPSPRSVRGQLQVHEEPFIIPLAIPLVASPALLTTVMLYSHIETNVCHEYSALILAWLASSFIFFLNKPILRLFGLNGLSALERLLSLVLVMLSVQMVLEGVDLFRGQYIR